MAPHVKFSELALPHLLDEAPIQMLPTAGLKFPHSQPEWRMPMLPWPDLTTVSPRRIWKNGVSSVSGNGIETIATPASSSNVPLDVPASLRPGSGANKVVETSKGLWTPPSQR